jgi:transposase
LKASRAAPTELTPPSLVREILRSVIRTLVSQLRKLKEHIQLLVNSLLPSLLAGPGVGPIVAGVLLAETGDPRRFASVNHLASYGGAAPVERGSGQNRRRPVNPGGNRRLNWALHLVALVRLRMDGGRSKRFRDKLLLRGKTKTLGSPATQNRYRSRVVSRLTAVTPSCNRFCFCLTTSMAQRATPGDENRSRSVE